MRPINWRQNWMKAKFKKARYWEPFRPLHFYPHCIFEIAPKDKCLQFLFSFKSRHPHTKEKTSGSHIRFTRGKTFATEGFIHLDETFLLDRIKNFPQHFYVKFRFEYAESDLWGWLLQKETKPRKTVTTHPLIHTSIHPFDKWMISTALPLSVIIYNLQQLKGVTRSN